MPLSIETNILLMMSSRRLSFIETILYLYSYNPNNNIVSIQKFYDHWSVNSWYYNVQNHNNVIL